MTPSPCTQRVELAVENQPVLTEPGITPSLHRCCCPELSQATFCWPLHADQNNFVLLSCVRQTLGMLLINLVSHITIVLD